MPVFFQFMVVQAYVHALKLQTSGSLTFPPTWLPSFRILALTLSFIVEVDVYKYWVLEIFSSIWLSILVWFIKKIIFPYWIATTSSSKITWPHEVGFAFWSLCHLLCLCQCDNWSQWLWLYEELGHPPFFAFFFFRILLGSFLSHKIEPLLQISAPQKPVKILKINFMLFIMYVYMVECTWLICGGQRMPCGQAIKPHQTPWLWHFTDSQSSEVSTHF